MMFSISIMHHLSPTRARHVKKNVFLNDDSCWAAPSLFPLSPSSVIFEVAASLNLLIESEAAYILRMCWKAKIHPGHPQNQDYGR